MYDYDSSKPSSYLMYCSKKPSSYLMYWDLNNLHKGRCHQYSQWIVLNRRKNKFHFYEDLIQIYDEDNDVEYILEVDVKYPQQLHKAQWFTVFTWKNDNKLM